jgi:hypothetical protein
MNAAATAASFARGPINRTIKSLLVGLGWVNLDHPIKQVEYPPARMRPNGTVSHVFIGSGDNKTMKGSWCDAHDVL